MTEASELSKITDALKAFESKYGAASVSLWLRSQLKERGAKIDIDPWREIVDADVELEASRIKITFEHVDGSQRAKTTVRLDRAIYWKLVHRLSLLQSSL